MTDKLSGWDYVLDFADRRGFDGEELKRLAEELFTKQQHQNGPLTYHPHLYVLASCFDNPVVVETGTQFGLSTYYALKAGAQRVYTCDPMHHAPSVLQTKAKQTIGVDLDMERVCFYYGSSLAALPHFAKQQPEWDIFLHDSSHDAFFVREECKHALEHVRLGGLILVNEYQWAEANRKVDAFGEFVEANGLSYHTIGNLAVVERVASVQAVDADGNVMAEVKTAEPFVVDLAPEVEDDESDDEVGGKDSVQQPEGLAPEDEDGSGGEGDHGEAEEEVGEAEISGGSDPGAA